MVRVPAPGTLAAHRAPRPPPITLFPAAANFLPPSIRSQLAFSRSALRRHYTATPKAQLQKLEGAFCAAVEAHIPKSGVGMTFASAWLATDNIVVHLLHKCVGARSA